MGASRTRLRMWTTIASHTVVDFFSFLVVPLLSVLEGEVRMSHLQGALLLAVGQVASGVIQPVVALASDRFDTRWLGTLGFLVAAVAIGLVGYAETFSQLLVLQILGAAGIGAFHPVAAAAVGHLAGPRRSLGIAWFYLAGMLGGVLGNVSAGHYVERFARSGGSTDAGLKALLYLTPVGIAFVIALGLAIHGMPHRTHDAHTVHRALPEAERRKRWTGVWLLYAGNVLRFGVDVCLIQLIIRWTELMALDRSTGGVFTDAVRIDASQLNGPLQAAKQVGMGLGGVALGWWFHVRHERALLVVMPLVGAAMVAALPYTGSAMGLGGVALGWWFHVRHERALLVVMPLVGAAMVAALPYTGGAMALVVCALAGLGYGAVVPMTISMAQRLIPHRTSLASGLMMGGAWAVASVGSPISQRLSERFGLETAFLAVAVSLLFASLIGLLIPKAAERVTL